MLFALLACTPTETTDDLAPDGDALDPVAQAWVDAHNDARGRAEPTPDPALEDVGWDETLAAYAAEWAAGCVFEHSVGAYGENLALFSWEGEPVEAVEGWFSEIEYYDYGTNRCDPGEMCGHYTQVVWRDTENIGCAVQACANVQGFGRGWLYVCEYDPPGNWVGEKPY
jgi:hypothetical protein